MTPMRSWSSPACPDPWQWWVPVWWGGVRVHVPGAGREVHVVDGRDTRCPFWMRRFFEPHWRRLWLQTGWCFIGANAFTLATFRPRGT